jgi:hypothetical protein
MSLHFLAGYVLGEHGRQSARLASTVAAAAAGSARREDVHDLHDRIDRLTLVVAAMWSLLQEQGMDEQALVERVEQMDAGDGVSDGKLTAAPVDCGDCRAKVPAGVEACQFCGTPIRGGKRADPFSQV